MMEMDKDERQNQPRGRYMNSIQSYQEPKNVNYNFGHGQYVPSLTSFNNGLLVSTIDINIIHIIIISF